jgi:NADP-dependent 3-hydroxy acid dehydrogenase YdfG
MMRKQKSGMIVNISSGAGRFGLPGSSAYKTNFLENLKQGQQAMNPDSPYAELSKKVSERVRESFKQDSSSSPVQVGEVILNAIKSENPNTRYLVGNDAAAIMERRKKSSDFEFERWMKESLLDQKGFVGR